MRHPTLWRAVSATLLATLLTPAPAAHSFEWAGRLRVTTRGLQDPRAAVRLQAVRALGELSMAEARPHLLRATGDSDDGVRLAAAAVLVQQRVPDVLPVLVEWLSDFELKVRVEAVRLLGQLGNPAAVGPLIRTFGDFEHAVRQEAVVALGRIGSRKAITGIIGRLDDPNVKVRQAAIGVLSELTDARSVIPLLGKLNDPSREIRQAAVKALARIGDARAIPPILRLLRDPAVQVRIEAISALGQLRTTIAAAALVNAFAQSRDLEERRALVKALGRISTDAARAALVRALFDPGLAEAVRDALVTAGPKVVPALTQALVSPRLQRTEAETVVKVLRDIGDRRASGALVREFQRRRVARKLVVEALATCGDTAAIIPLLRVLAGDSLEEKRLALRALEPIVDRRAIQPLLPVLREKEPDLRRLGVRILGRLRAREAIPTLLELLERDGVETRREVVLALGAIGDPRVGARLLPLLGDRDPELRRAVQNALAQLQPPELVKPLLALATAPDAEVERTRRAQALDALGAVLRGRSVGPHGPALASLLRADEPTLTTAVLTAIAATGDRALAPRLCAFLPKAPPRLRPKVLETLGHLPTRESTAILRDALRSKDWRQRAVAAWALGRPGHAGAEAALVGALTDEHPGVQVNAAGALARHPTPAARAALRRALLHQDPDPYLLANVVLALGKLGDRERIDAVRRLLAWERTIGYLNRNVLRALHALGVPAKELRALAASRNDEALEKLVAALEAGPPAASAPTWIGLDLVDAQGNRMRNVPFLLALSDGVVRWALTDERGQAYEERIPAGTVHYEQLRLR